MTDEDLQHLRNIIEVIGGEDVQPISEIGRYHLVRYTYNEATYYSLHELVRHGVSWGWLTIVFDVAGRLTAETIARGLLTFSAGEARAYSRSYTILEHDRLALACRCLLLPEPLQEVAHALSTNWQGTFDELREACSLVLV